MNQRITQNELIEIKTEYQAGRVRPTLVSRLIATVEVLLVEKAALQGRNDWLEDQYRELSRNLETETEAARLLAGELADWKEKARLYRDAVVGLGETEL